MLPKSVVIQHHAAIEDAPFSAIGTLASFNNDPRIAAESSLLYAEPFDPIDGFCGKTFNSGNCYRIVQSGTPNSIKPVGAGALQNSGCNFRLVDWLPVRDSAFVRSRVPFTTIECRDI